MGKRTQYVAIGQRFQRWTVVEADVSGAPRHSARCRCQCGAERVVAIGNLVSGRSKSCGCLRAEVTSSLRHSHGVGYEDYRYRLWRTLMNKCYTVTHRDYPYYGGRGITVWEPWHQFERFRDDLDATLGPRPEGLTMDRINNEGSYEPDNIRWASRQEQALNRRNRWRRPHPLEE